MPARGENLAARKIPTDDMFLKDRSALPAVLSRADGRLEATFARASVAFPPESVALIALKREGRLEVWARGAADREWAFVRSYPVRATSGRLGPKLRQGDHQVPEGLYRVSALNPNSNFHLSLRLNYPNDFDRSRAADDGRSRLGGDIMIHGGAASDGCLPVGDEAAEDLFALADIVGPDKVSVIVSPADLRTFDVGRALTQVRSTLPWLGDLYAAIAEELRSFPTPADGQVSRAEAKLKLGRARCTPYDARDCVKRCEKGDSASCARAGLMYRDGRGVMADDRLAWSFLRRACAAGDALGCAELGSLYLSDDGTRHDVGRAADLARAACDAGDGHGCVYLAAICHDGILYTDDGVCGTEAVNALRARAVALLDSGCKGWGAYDCATLSDIYAVGDSMTAMRFAAGACKGGDPGGCYAEAELSEKGADASRAHDLYRTACKAGFAIACERYALAR